MILYAVVKFAAYALWCLIGLRLLTGELNYLRALRLGAVRWLIGLGFGVAAGIVLGSVSRDSVTQLYFGVYVPLRIVEWSIMVWMIARGLPDHAILSRDPKFRVRTSLWVLGGIAVSFLSDLASPDGMAGRFCVGRCLC